MKVSTTLMVPVEIWHWQKRICNVAPVRPSNNRSQSYVFQSASVPLVKANGPYSHLRRAQSLIQSGRKSPLSLLLYSQCKNISITYSALTVWYHSIRKVNQKLGNVSQYSRWCSLWCLSFNELLCSTDGSCGLQCPGQVVDAYLITRLSGHAVHTALWRFL